MRRFDLNMKRIVFVAGGPIVAARLKQIADDSGLGFQQPANPAAGHTV
jgi:hypothetical protein